MGLKTAWKKVQDWWKGLDSRLRCRITGFIVGYLSWPAVVCVLYGLFSRPFHITWLLFAMLGLFLNPVMVSINIVMALIGAILARRFYGLRRWRLKLALTLLVIAAIIGLGMTIFIGIMVFAGRAGNL